MPIWIAVTLFAAFMQNLRFVLQRHLKVTTLSTAGATWTRFIFSAPLVVCVVAIYASLGVQELPRPDVRFWAFILPGSLAQILATMCVVALFGFRNFPVGITLAKTEVILTAIVGLILLGDAVGGTMWLAIGLGFVGVVLLSDPPRAEGGLAAPLPWAARLFNRASGLGVASGLLFAISATGYRGASLSLESGDVFLRASLTLAVATSVQALTLGLWLLWRERGQISRVLTSWRVSIWVGVTLMVGSLAWFTAFTLQTAALVKALGQVELVFTFLFSVFWLKERSSGKELAGVALLLGSIGLIFVGTF